MEEIELEDFIGRDFDHVKKLLEGRGYEVLFKNAKPKKNIGKKLVCKVEKVDQKQILLTLDEFLIDL